ncbi:hypothetical protein, partial [Vibrio crassostreae]|uniref:hypothetical protein n=1 Tax=Vibrio crassostreae TaxID=246167 RepID=UPI001B3097FF
MNAVANIAEIKECMGDLGISLEDKLLNPVEARFFNNKTHSAGNIVVTFNNNFQSGHGPYIEFDEVIRTFGISYEVFKPQYQSFSYDSQERKLNVKGNGYE